MTLTRDQIDGVDAPALGDVVAGRAADMSEEERQKRMAYAALVASLTQIMRSFWTSDGISDRDLACLVRAVSGIVQSDDFEAAAAAVKREVKPVSHADTGTFTMMSWPHSIKAPHLLMRIAQRSVNDGQPEDLR